MEYFLESTHLDNATAEMLKKYDTDGNGSFTKYEVVEIILDLRREIESNAALGRTNKFLRQAICAAVVFCLILMSSIFGLTYAVAALTAKLDVDASTGVMTTPDGKHVVVTDSFSYKAVTSHDELTGTHCLASAELGDLIGRVVNGNGVNLEMVGTGVNGTEAEVQKLTGSLQFTEGSICFMASNGKEICAEPSDDCAAAAYTSGRRLASSVDDCLAFGYSTVSTPWIFWGLVSPADSCTRNCPTGDRIATGQYKVTSCVCECAVAAGSNFAFSFTTRP